MRVGTAKVPRLAITEVGAPRGAHLEGSAILQVGIEANEALGETRLQVFDGSALVGEATHRWPAAGSEYPIAATVPVEWIPLAPGPRRLRVTAAAIDAAGDATEAEAETAVDVRAGTTAVAIYEPETTWMGTFVRRALEADARLIVRGRVQVAPTVAVARGDAPTLRRDALEDVAAVIVTAPDRLTVSDVELLERYARVRGGSVVLLPDRELAGPVTRITPRATLAPHEAEPQTVGPLRARDLITFPRTETPGLTVLESAGDRPVIVTRAIGRGRIIVSGALDAWRYRDGGGFGRFWSSLIADAASAAGPPVTVALDRSLLEPGEETTVRVEWRTIDEIGPELTTEASIDCQGERRPIRLWPEGRRGSFIGTIEAGRAGPCVVMATAGNPPRRATAAFAVSPGVRRPVPGARAFAGAIAAHGGIVVSDGEEALLVARAHELLPVRHQRRDTRPMQSPWWILPFTACLGAEWALRRRAGLR